MERSDRQLLHGISPGRVCGHGSSPIRDTVRSFSGTRRDHDTAAELRTGTGRSLRSFFSEGLVAVYFLTFFVLLYSYHIYTYDIGYNILLRSDEIRRKGNSSRFPLVKFKHPGDSLSTSFRHPTLALLISGRVTRRQSEYWTGHRRDALHSLPTL